MYHLWRRVALGTVLALGLALTPAVAGQASGSPAAGPWSVVPLAGGYQVTLTLAEPLPARDALPELAVNGKSVGYAQQSPDGRTLTLVTTDPVAANPSSVDLAWNGSVVQSRSAAPVKVPAASTTLAVDPTAPGPYRIDRADYDFGDTAVALGALGGRPAENRAAVWVPADAAGARPLVVLLHGRHAACYQPGTTTVDNQIWPCRTDLVPVPSYRGYDRSGEVLASHGYVVVSISANGINAQDNPYSDDGGALARAQLVLHHLDLLAKANAGQASGMSPLLTGRVDLNRVGLMGHSRGGDGVVRTALLNASLPKPYGINAVLPLAPIDPTRQALPDVPMAVLLPYCDGDVVSLEGQHFYEDSRYAHPGDDVLRSSLVMLGTNHNFFNTEWTPGVSVSATIDDWKDPADPACGPTVATTTRLSAADQYQLGVAYTAGFFRLVIGRENAFLPMFQSSVGSAVRVGAATVLQEAQSPSSRRLDVASLRAPAPNVTFSGKLAAQYCASIGGRSPQSGLPSCSASTFVNRFPSFIPAAYSRNVTAAPMLHLNWTSAGTARVDMPSGRYDVSKFGALTLRAAIDDANTTADLTLTVVDGAGRTQSVAMSSLSGAMSVLPGSGDLLPKTWLQTVRWPVAQMGRVNVRDIRQVLISTATLTGGVFLSDIAFATPGVGAGGPSTLPRITVTGTTVVEGDTPTAAVTLALSHASPVPVTAELQVVGGGSTQVSAAAYRAVIPAGARTAQVTIPVVDNTTVEASADTAYRVAVGASTNAVMERIVSSVVVRDDDRP
jgi:hypothetical protein